MEITPKLSAMDYHSNVDSSRPFRSVKEAVAIFGERFLVKEMYSPKPFMFPAQESPWNSNYSPRSVNSQEIVPSVTSWKSASPPQDLNNNNNDPIVAEALKKLENELEETKTELKLLKARESETEIALASLNAELHKNMSKLAQAEAAHAGAMAAASRSVKINNEDYGKKKKEMRVKWESSPTLADMLTIGETDLGLLGKKKKKSMKKKPIIPLVADLFSRKKRSSTTVDNPLFASTHLF